MLDERSRRRFAAAEALAAGRGGIAAVARATGIARSTIGRALREVRSGETLDPGRVRRPGAGGKLKSETDASLLDDLRALIEPETRGDPQSPLLWTCKSLRKLAGACATWATRSAARWWANCCTKLGYSLQANRKTREGSNHPDRDAQFHYINDQVKAALAAANRRSRSTPRRRNWSATSRMAGANGIRKARRRRFGCTTSSSPNSGRAVPYGVYDIADNTGWVSVGIDHDTAAFAVNAIRSWWTQMGRERYPDATRLLITADGGGSNGSRVRLWKLELQRLADELGMPITVCHLPPGTSKWNKIEHRLFSFITANWRGKPLVSHQVIVELIAATTTETGLNGALPTRSPTPIPPASKSPTPKCKPSISNPMTSTANGTTPSTPTPDPT